ncbi:MAG: hypothetical protein ABSG15_05500 [FCB group bacterium]|jgi:hypothetical protein
MGLEIFWEAFAKELHSKLKDDKNWIDTYNNPTTWTKVLEKIMNQIGRRLFYLEDEIKIHPQHKRYDTCFGEKNINGDYDIEFVIEFENYAHNWRKDELPKLLNARAIYKVLISYFWTGNRTKNNSIEKIKVNLLNEYNQDQLKGIDNNFLFIFAPNKAATMSIQEFKNLDIRSFRFKNGIFEDMKDIEIFRRLL